jgi:hypothetical protein
MHIINSVYLNYTSTNVRVQSWGGGKLYLRYKQTKGTNFVAISLQGKHTDRETTAAGELSRILRTESVAWSAQQISTADSLGVLDRISEGTRRKEFEYLCYTPSSVISKM